jgi:hypothetical protein
VYSSTNTFLFQVEWGEIGRYKGSSVKKEKKIEAGKRFEIVLFPFEILDMFCLPSIKS